MSSGLKNKRIEGLQNKSCHLFPGDKSNPAQSEENAHFYPMLHVLLRSVSKEKGRHSMVLFQLIEEKNFLFLYNLLPPHSPIVGGSLSPKSHYLTLHLSWYLLPF